MHEWLSGGVSPCQGEGRGFESRLVLENKRNGIIDTVPFIFERSRAPKGSKSRLPARSALNGLHRRPAPRLVLSLFGVSYAAALRSLNGLRFTSVLPKPTSTGCRGTSLRSGSRSTFFPLFLFRVNTLFTHFSAMIILLVCHTVPFNRHGIQL